MIGIKRTVTGTLSRNPERTEVKTKTRIDVKKRSPGVIPTMKLFMISIIPTFSKQKISINNVIKKKGNLKSTFLK
jgi:hypothetical protein